MKKIILTVCFLFMIQSFVFADEIIDAKGNIIPCKVTNVSDGYIQYVKDGNNYTFQRENDSLVFNDYADVRVHLFKKNSITRYSGKIIIKDLENVVIRNENGIVAIPWYRVKSIGVYKP